MTDAAASLHGECGFLDVIEYRGHVVLDPAHHEAVEQRHIATTSRAGQYSPGWEKREVRHGVKKTSTPKTWPELCFLLALQRLRRGAAYPR